ncbi:uncharacterized protein LOC103575328 isoform X3 [Microplitis demolitor]|uniref:uncharacterized protein LOC103575328 isoform X3 n=1 Tax=Microplitis demolitor TaxID=69319 RepID=UPI0004CD1280|nr:uncharacterized protein LOC103575328 isoform X3 [Microplitis demolitor]
MFLKLTLITLLTAIIIATKSDPKAAKCLRPGQTCSSNDQCCSNKCDGICMQVVKSLPDYLMLMRSVIPGFCLSTGAQCNINNNCCSSKCVRAERETYYTCIDNVSTSTANNTNNNNDETTIEKIETETCRANGLQCIEVEHCCSKFCVARYLVGVVYMFCAPLPNPSAASQTQKITDVTPSLEMAVTGPRCSVYEENFLKININ